MVLQRGQLRISSGRQKPEEGWLERQCAVSALSFGGVNAFGLKTARGRAGSGREVKMSISFLTLERGLPLPHMLWVSQV